MRWALEMLLALEFCAHLDVGISSMVCSGLVFGILQTTQKRRRKSKAPNAAVAASANLAVIPSGAKLDLQVCQFPN
jgi:hypothetical protein